MLRTRNFVKRTVAVTAVAAALVGAAALPAHAATASTTGASGRWANATGDSYNLYATDTLSDGHCARWQHKVGSGSWQWIGTSACSGSEQRVATGYGRFNHFYRICRTGVGNCSRLLEFA